MLRLNFCVRDGNRWIPQAIVTGNVSGSSVHSRFPSLRSLPLPLRFRSASGFRFLRSALHSLASAPSKPHRIDLESSSVPLRFSAPAFALASSLRFLLSQQCLALDQALDRLVSASYICYHTSTADLSTSSSLRGLTYLRSGSLLLQGGFTLRCLQRLSRPHFASLLCPWQNNSFTRGASIPVLSY